MKKVIIRDLTVREVSTVDRPAQRGAVAVITKRAGSDICKNAAEVARGEAEPLFDASDYRDAIMTRAEELGKEHGCSVGDALLRHSDSVTMELAKAEHAAEFEARSKRHASRLGKVDWKPIEMDGEDPLHQRWCLKCGGMFIAAQPDQTTCEGRTCVRGS